MAKSNKVHTSSEQYKAFRAIQALQEVMEEDILDSSELMYYEDMTKRQKKKLVCEIYFSDKKGAQRFYKCKDGRIKSIRPQFIAVTEDELIDKLYDYYFNNTVSAVFKRWILYRSKKGIVSPKTIEEDIGMWNRFLADSEIAHMQISQVRTKHLLDLFYSWTGQGLITRKEFCNRKSMLNGIFGHAVICELIDNNPIISIPTNDFNFKLPNKVKKAYTIDERRKLLEYLDTLEPDAYILAIKLAFYGIFRIGEIKAIRWDEYCGNTVHISKQLVEVRKLKEDFTLGAPERELKNPKGNPNYSIRSQVVSEKALEILKQMKALNPDGELLFMHQGRPLTTDTFNNRLKKYCKECGIPYLSSHKIRFTDASILYQNGVKAIDIQPLLGHSTLAMTEHYIGQKVDDNMNSKLAEILN